MLSEMHQVVTKELCCGYKPRSEHWVRVTHVINPHCFYVRPIEYIHYLDHLEKMININEIDDLKVQKLVTFRSNHLGNQKTIRGRVLFIDNTLPLRTCDLFALDYGFIEKKVPLHHIYKCDMDVLMFPALALRCELDMCAPKNGSEWTFESIEALKDYFGNEKAKMIVKHKTNDKLIVEMINSCPDDIATMMIYAGYSTLGYVNNMISRVPELPSNF